MISKYQKKRIEGDSMNDVIIIVKQENGEAYTYNNKLGNQHQNLQNKLKFEFIDNIPKGIAWLEYEIDGNKNYALMEKYEKGYQIDIKSCLLISNYVEVDLKITQEENPNGIPVFVSSIVKFEVEKTINAEDEEPEQYPSWFDNANKVLKEASNLDLDVSKVGDTSTITITKKDGTQKIVEVYDGTGESGTGGTGENGATFTPSVSEDGVISWTNDKGLDNPSPINIKGPKGDIGEKGENGDKGEPGTNGTNGKDGQSATITVGSVTTLEAGSNATVTNVGTETNAIFNFGIPKGFDGYSSGGEVDLSSYATKKELENKADKSTTLSGYGITNAYTKLEINDMLSGISSGEGTSLAKGTVGNNFLTSEVNNEIYSTYMNNKELSKLPTGTTGNIFNFDYVTSDLFDYKIEDNMFLKRLKIKFGEHYADGDEVKCYLCTYNSENGSYKCEKEFVANITSNEAIFTINTFMNEYESVYFFFSGYVTTYSNITLYEETTGIYWIKSTTMGIGTEYRASLYNNNTCASLDVVIYYSTPLSEEKINDILSDENYKLSSGVISNDLVSTTNFEYSGLGNTIGYFMNMLDIKALDNGLLRQIDIFSSTKQLITVYVCYKDEQGEYIIIDNFSGKPSDNLLKINCNIDVSEYDNIYIVANYVDYPKGTTVSGQSLKPVSIDGDKIVVSSGGVSVYQNINVYFQKIITADDFANIPNQTQIDMLNKLISQENRTVYQNNISNLKPLINEKFEKQNEMLTYTNSTISENKLICLGNTRTYLTNGTAIDLVKNVVKFKYVSASIFGTNIGNVLVTVNTSSKKFALYTGYGESSSIPSTSVAEGDISFDFNVDSTYTIELIKNAMNYTAKLIDMNTMTTIELIYSAQNVGLGTPAIVSFSGEVHFTEFKYYVPLYGYSKVLFLGDSVTEGVGVNDDLDSRWCAQLRDKYFNFDGVIAGVGGNTTTQGLERYKKLISLGYSFEYIIIFFGLNDMRTGGSVEDWKTNITTFRNKVIENGSKPIICIPQLLEGGYTTSFEEARDFIIENNWDCIRFDLISNTNLHPDKAGHDEMYEIATKCLDAIV